MCVRKSVTCLLAIMLISVLITVHGASIEKSVSVSVSTSTSESKSEQKNGIEKASARSLNSAESYESKVEISAPYARKVINNFSNDDKSRSLKVQNETTTKKDDPITTTTTTEKSKSEPEITTTELNQSDVPSEIFVKKIEFDVNSSPILKESSEPSTEKDDIATTTILNETISKKDDAITTTKPENETESQTSSTEFSSSESSSTELSTTESSSTESNTTDTTAIEPNSTETIIETTQINLTSDNVKQTERSLTSRSLKEENKTISDQIVFVDQTTTVPKVDLGSRSGTETDELCETKVDGDCQKVFP